MRWLCGAWANVSRVGRADGAVSAEQLLVDTTGQTEYTG